MTQLQFDGDTIDQAADTRRLENQYVRIFEVMKDGKWRTLHQIEQMTGYQLPSISARLRDFRKDKNGGHTVNRRRAQYRSQGIHEYQLIVRP